MSKLQLGLLYWFGFTAGWWLVRAFIALTSYPIWPPQPIDIGIILSGLLAAILVVVVEKL